MKRWQDEKKGLEKKNEERAQDKRKKRDVQEISGEMLGGQKRWTVAHAQMNNWSES